MSSKMVTDLRKLGVLVTAATSDRSRNDKAMQGLLARCADVVPEGTTSATVEEAQAYIGQQIAFETEALRHYDDDHVGRLVDVDAKRSARDSGLTEAYGVVLQTRRAFEIVHGPGSGIALLGLDTTVPDDPQRFYQMADRCRRWLRDPQRIFPEAELKAFSFDRERAAEDMDGPVDRLEQALRSLPEELKSSIDSLAGKFAAMQRLDRLVGQGARFTEALYDLAGMEFESARLRPSSHRSADASEAAAAAGADGTAGAEASSEAEAETPTTEAPAAESPEAESAAPESPAAGSPAAGSPAAESPAA